MGLETYRKKRDSTHTPEPEGHLGPSGAKLLFVIHKHAARRLHYDLRLELKEVFKSWAVPKGPSLDPADKRLAVLVEDHPLDYGSFEGVIPEGEYGAGSVLLWDRGTWEPEGDPEESYRQARLRFQLHGEKLRGTWSLVRMGGPDSNQWLLIKSRDASARPGFDVEKISPLSVLSGRTNEDIASGAASSS
jgi:bifunctional non-homologous end joining protein LigD